MFVRELTWIQRIPGCKGHFFRSHGRSLYACFTVLKIFRKYNFIVVEVVKVEKVLEVIKCKQKLNFVEIIDCLIPHFILKEETTLRWSMIHHVSALAFPPMFSPLSPNVFSSFRIKSYSIITRKEAYELRSLG